MLDKDEIFAQLRVLLIELFQFDDSKIQPTARLIEDLDFDSIDIIDLVHRLEDDANLNINLEEFKGAKSLQDVVDVIHRLQTSS